jgi:uncharacterized protein (TIGR03435 family)
LKEKSGTKTKPLVGVSVLALITVAVVVKWMFFPSIKDAYFAMDARSLRQAPAGLVLIRPTHFAFLHGDGILFAPPPRVADHGRWMMGRNASLREVIAAAYDRVPSRVIMPPGAPTGHFDFMVTTRNRQNEHLQSAIRKKLGYIAQKEKRDTDVLALKVKNANSPGLVISGPQEKPNLNFLDVRVQFTHLPVAVLASGLNQFLRTPVVDETGLTNFYDFSIPWNPRSRQSGGGINSTNANKMLADLGLELEPSTAPLEMLVVKKVK